MSSRSSEANSLYSMETQGKDHQQVTRYRMSRHMTLKITRVHLNNYPPSYPYIAV